MQSSLFEPNGKYKVMVKCLTYNHSSYIMDTLNGFAMQMTTFPYVCVVIDDFSNDGERDIIESFIVKECKGSDHEKYDLSLANVVIARSKYNNNCTFAFYLLKQNLFKQKEKRDALLEPWEKKCEYQALCEGDDYWISPVKLQKQVLFLENNKDYLLIGSNGIVQEIGSSKGLHYFNTCFDTRQIAVEEMVKTWFFPTASIVYRMELLKLLPEWRKEIYYRDNVIVLTSAINGKVACLGDATCVYRKGCGITKELDKQQIYLCQQHLIFYRHLKEDTGELYQECFNEKIRLLEKDLSFYETKSKSSVLWLIKYPKKALRFLIVSKIPTIKAFLLHLLH